MNFHVGTIVECDWRLVVMVTVAHNNHIKQIQTGKQAKEARALKEKWIKHTEYEYCI